ncbi:MAG: efflux RND transporter periplasmic adaptor subunit [Micropepsaceae bacterium]
MRAKLVWVAAALVLAAAGGVTWWLTSGHGDMAREVASTNTGRILYYQDPSGAAVFSPVPKKDTQGRDFVAVRAPGEQSKQTERKVLYYRNPMGLADTSPTPKKDSMGMDYIPVYVDESEQPGTVKISPEKVQRLGVRTAAVSRQVLNESVVLSGTVVADERKLSVVSLKFPANVVTLHVASTGEKVRKGQALFEINSPFLLQQETTLAIALKARAVSQELGDVYARTNERSAASARARLENYEVPKREIERLIRTGEPSGHIVWPAPQDGTVIEKPVVAGMRAEGGETLYRLADLSNVWVIAEAPEMALGIARAGAGARITLNAFAGRVFEGKVTFVYPEVAMATRTAKVRIELANAEGLLIPGMFASVEVAAPAGEAVLTVPDSALIDSGARQVVLVARGGGVFEPRTVTAGRRANNMVEIASGLKDGETVVTSATFLIDAESNLRAALQGFSGATP